MTPSYPRILPAGLGGLVVQFAPVLSEPANRAALAFRAAVEGAGWAGLTDCATALVSVFVGFDPFASSNMRDAVARLLASRDWLAEPLRTGRDHLVPVVLDGPDLPEAAALAGLTVPEARASLLAEPLRVLTIGFAPGQPYAGELPDAWAIPRRPTLTPQVPEGALVVAIRQAIIFAAPAPTGWWWVGTTAFRPFRPDLADPFVLRAGDTITLQSVSRDQIAAQRAAEGLPC